MEIKFCIRISLGKHHSMVWFRSLLVQLYFSRAKYISIVRRWSVEHFKCALTYCISGFFSSGLLSADSHLDIKVKYRPVHFAENTVIMLCWSEKMYLNSSRFFFLNFHNILLISLWSESRSQFCGNKTFVLRSISTDVLCGNFTVSKFTFEFEKHEHSL